MVEESMPAWDQLAIWLNAMTENKSSIPRTMIVFETGRAAGLEQIRIDIPIITDVLPWGRFSTAGLSR